MADIALLLESGAGLLLEDGDTGLLLDAVRAASGPGVAWTRPRARRRRRWSPRAAAGLVVALDASTRLSTAIERDDEEVLVLLLMARPLAAAWPDRAVWRELIEEDER